MPIVTNQRNKVLENIAGNGENAGSIFTISCNIFSTKIPEHISIILSHDYL